MSGPALSPIASLTRRTLRLVQVDERELGGGSHRFWELTLHKSDTGGYVLESVLRGSASRGRPMAATLSFAGPAALRDFLGGAPTASALAAALLERAAALDPELAKGSQP